MKIYVYYFIEAIWDTNEKTITDQKLFICNVRSFYEYREKLLEHVSPSQYELIHINKIKVIEINEQDS
jgi:hypothetical protein